MMVYSNIGLQHPLSTERKTSGNGWRVLLEHAACPASVVGILTSSFGIKKNSGDEK